jgi:hypothetical protein
LPEFCVDNIDAEESAFMAGVCECRVGLGFFDLARAGEK